MKHSKQIKRRPLQNGFAVFFKFLWRWVSPHGGGYNFPIISKTSNVEKPNAYGVGWIAIDEILSGNMRGRVFAFGYKYHNT